MKQFIPTLKFGFMAFLAGGFLFLSSCKKDDPVTPAAAAAEPVAAFSADKTTGATPLNVTFTNSSSGATNYEWDFGDGSSSTSSNTSHSFSNTSTTSARSFTVTLRALNAAGKSSTTSRTINVEAATAALTKSEIITAGPWKITAFKMFDGTTTTDVYFLMDDCGKDDIFSFKTNGTYSNEEGATKCNQNDPTVIDTGTWSLSSDEKIFIVDAEEWTFVNALTTSAMKISFETDDGNGNKVEITMEFTR
ncbi:MAG: PKD repeat protein [Flavobacteriales bacterium]|jgi:PKD repeat protein